MTIKQQIFSWLLDNDNKNTSRFWLICDDREMILKHANKYSDRTFFKHPRLPTELLEQRASGVTAVNFDDADFFWLDIVKNPAVSEQFLETHMDNIDYIAMTCNPNISKEFMEKHFHRYRYPVSWLDFLKSRLPEHLVDKLIENDPKLLKVFCGNPNCSIDFYRRHLSDQENFCWSRLSANPSVPQEFFEEHLDKITGKLSPTSKFSPDFIERHRKLFSVTQFNIKWCSEKLAREFTGNKQLSIFNNFLSEQYFTELLSSGTIDYQYYRTDSTLFHKKVALAFLKAIVKKYYPDLIRDDNIDLELVQNQLPRLFKENSILLYDILLSAL